MQPFRSWMSHLGLWPRLALAIGLGFLALFAAVVIIGEWALQSSTDRILDERLVIARMAASRIDSLLEQAVYELEQAQQVADFDPDDSDLSAEFDVLTHTLSQIGLFTSGVTFISPSGEALLSSPPGLYASGTNLADLPHVAQSLSSRKAVISDPFTDPLREQPVTAVTIPLIKDGRFLGLLSGLVSLNAPWVTDALHEAARIGDTGHATLIDENGRTLVATLDIPFLTFSEHPDFYPQAMSKGEPAVSTTPFGLRDVAGEHYGENHVMALAPLSTTAWGVAVGGDEDETFAGLRRLRSGMIIVSSITLVIVGATTLLGARSLIRPIQRLTATAQEIDQGNLHTSFQAPGWGEIGEMVAALENMRLKLLSNMQELANWNETLETQVNAQTKEIKKHQILTQSLLRRALTAQETERVRISRELHDEIGQMLTAIEFSLARLHLTLSSENKKAYQRLEQSQSLTGKTVTDLRRIIAALRPVVLDELGLVSALHWLGEHILNPAGITLTVEADDLPARLPGIIETTLFRIAQEAVNNVTHHSQASCMTARLSQNDQEAVMALVDNGRGFDPSTVSPDPDQNRGFGLAGMQERAAMVNGRVTVKSKPGQGTSIHVIIPVAVIATCSYCPFEKGFPEECEVCLVSVSRFD